MWERRDVTSLSSLPCFIISQPSGQIGSPHASLCFFSTSGCMCLRVCECEGGMVIVFPSVFSTGDHASGVGCVCAARLWSFEVGWWVWCDSLHLSFCFCRGLIFFFFIICAISLYWAIQIVTFVGGGGGVNSIFFFGHFLYLKLLWLHCVCVCVCNTQQVDTKWRRWFLPMCPPLSLVFMSLVSTSLPFNLRYRHKIRCVVLPAHSKWTVYERIRNLHKMLNQISRCP